MKRMRTNWARHPQFIAVLCLLCVLFPEGHCGILLPVAGLPMTNYSKPGNVTIGVVTSVHRYSERKLCGEKKWHIGRLQQIEAIAFAVEEINKRKDILPNITLGFIMLDDCSNEQATLLRGLQLVQNSSHDITELLPLIPSLPPVAAMAVIGADTSYQTLQLADLLSIYKIPMLSYTATSTALDNKHYFPYFSRIIPSDIYQANVLVAIMREMAWNYVSVIYTDDDYGTQGFQMLQNKLEQAGFCLAVTASVKTSTRDDEYRKILHDLKKKPEAPVVVLYTEKMDSVRLFRTVSVMGLQDDFIWLGTVTMLTNLYDYMGYEDVIDGALAVSFQSDPVERFNERFRHMAIGADSPNPWFRDWVSLLFDCSWGMGSSNLCDPNQEIGKAPTYRPERTISMAINTVYALAYALDDMLKTYPETDSSTSMNPELLLETIRKTQFNGEGQEIRIDKNGNGMSNYEIINCVFDKTTLTLKKIGDWDLSTNTFSTFNKDHIQWKSKLLPAGEAQVGIYPMSVCSQPCPIGYKKVAGPSVCCFTCAPCEDFERTVEDVKTKSVECQTCPTEDNYSWPDRETRTKCLPIKATYLLDLTHDVGLLLFTFNLVVLFASIVITAFYIMNANQFLIKTSGITMGLTMLAGHVLTCLIIFSFHSYPTDFSCSIIAFSFQMAFPLTYAPLFVRIQYIYCHYILPAETASKRLLTSSKNQILIVIAMVLVQVLISSMSILLLPPSTAEHMYNINHGIVDRECVFHGGDMIGCLFCDMVVAVLINVRAFQIRAFDGCFRESRFINFTLYNCNILWMCFMPAYLIISKFSHLAACTEFALLLQIVFFQFFIFVPKLYAHYRLPVSAYMETETCASAHAMYKLPTKSE